MLQFFTIIKTIVAILPILRDLIMASEAFFPAQGSGVQKLELVRVMLQHAYETAVKIETPFSSIWPTLAKLIDFTVPAVVARTPSVAAAVSPAVMVAATAAIVSAAPAKTAPAVQLSASDA